ncbi:MAG: hypothetical protein NMK33_00515 [Candidatus Cardinium sp.]|uniref:hypothetical protein n=1 Tax=Cardinium endosymbiont of Dermatophagoides farinae TaxID=2597823 RepID=UPI001183D86D|nr:hypothetical protein [Cardinium endosymbiont of Dermatophagoides farinae]TSJ81011.1 hypothetical protein FPG78_03190 [Cardinium endosymbiont of Dermatophagoides farinae]UWW97039.1 MAG: hypothetical protein NMK33_00515 [Candidatus Cardinium sp.]
MVKDHDPDLYQDLLQYIHTPCMHLAGKDRIVECRKIDDPNKTKIDYRIYKLPGEWSVGEPTQDYFSIHWDPSGSLDALDQYTWRDEQS